MGDLPADLLDDNGPEEDDFDQLLAQSAARRKEVLSDLGREWSGSKAPARRCPEGLVGRGGGHSPAEVCVLFCPHPFSSPIAADNKKMNDSLDVIVESPPSKRRATAGPSTAPDPQDMVWVIVKGDDGSILFSDTYFKVRFCPLLNFIRRPNSPIWQRESERSWVARKPTKCCS